MFKKENRLSTNFEFNITKKYGRRITGFYFSAYYLYPRNYTGPTRIGIVTSNKFHKNATVRNKVRRQFREIMRLNMDLLGENMWWVIFPKTASLGIEYEKIRSDFTKTLQKISLTN
jgi:ribonuclease P protein component